MEPERMVPWHLGKKHCAFVSMGITGEEQLARHTEAEILGLHGVGPGSLPRLRDALEKKGLTFRPDKE